MHTLRFAEAVAFGTLVLIVAGIVGALAPEANASAASTAAATLALSPASGAPGSTVTATGAGYGHNIVQLLWDGAADGMPQVQANGNGAFSATFRVPTEVALGIHTVSATSTSTGVSTNKNGRGPGGKSSGGSSSMVFSVQLVTAATPAPTPAPTAARTSAPTVTATATIAKQTPASTRTPSPTATALATATPVASSSPAPIPPPPSAVPAPTPSPTPAPVVTASPAPVVTPSPAPVSATGFVARCGSALCVNGAVWYLYGAAGRDVVSARAAHLNTIRITNWLHEEPGNDPYQESRWVIVDSVLAQAAASGMHAILDLSTYRNFLYNSSVNPYVQDWSTFITFVANRVNTLNGIRYKDDPTIAMVAFAGEVDGIKGNTDPRSPTTAQLNTFFQRSFDQWRTLDSRHLLQPGGLLHYSWDSGIDWRTIFSYADVCSIHNYSSDDTNATPTVAAYCASIGKPWITEEFGWSQAIGDATRAERFQSMYALQRANHAAGVAVWYFGPQLAGVNGVTETYDVNTATALTWNAVVASAP